MLGAVAKKLKRKSTSCKYASAKAVEKCRRCDAFAAREFASELFVLGLRIVIMKVLNDYEEKR